MLIDKHTHKRTPKNKHALHFLRKVRIRGCLCIQSWARVIRMRDGGVSKANAYGVYSCRLKTCVRILVNAGLTVCPETLQLMSLCLYRGIVVVI